jgi:predicted patatin/cPLA2 family phospholipase
MYKGLCLSGGGITGFAHLGVLQYLEDKGLTRDIEVMVCTSIGAVIGVLYAIGMKSRDIYAKMISMNHDLLLFGKIDDFFTSFGMDSGEYFMAKLVDIFIENNVRPTITFSNIYDEYKKDVVITGTNVSRHKSVYFNKDDNADMRILDAVRISISIPFLFSAVMFNKEIYVDGGLKDNYPIQHCIDKMNEKYPALTDPTKYVLGCYLESMIPKEICNIEDYIYSIFACCLKRQQSISLDPCTISIHIDDVSSVEFDADMCKRENMFQKGYLHAQNHILEGTVEEKTF